MLAAARAGFKGISFSFIAAFIAAAVCMLLVSGCTEEPKPDYSHSEEAIRTSLTNTLQAFESGDDQTVSMIASSIDATGFESPTVTSEELARDVLGGFDVQVGEVNVDEENATAEVYITCKNIPAIEQSIHQIAEEATNLEELANRINQCISEAEPHEIGPIMIEYEKVDDSWIPTVESRARLVEAIVNQPQDQQPEE